MMRFGHVAGRGGESRISSGRVDGQEGVCGGVGGRVAKV